MEQSVKNLDWCYVNGGKEIREAINNTKFGDGQ
jgi:hypothetical protein